ncbi:MAG: hypothetical protein KGQ59_05115 [Bdellovibrionales bacterium]|nr:hypothetical protein [Bdellovibrionales bacterium]
MLPLFLPLQVQAQRSPAEIKSDREFKKLFAAQDQLNQCKTVSEDANETLKAIDQLQKLNRGQGPSCAVTAKSAGAEKTDLSQEVLRRLMVLKDEQLIQAKILYSLFYGQVNPSDPSAAQKLKNNLCSQFRTKIGSQSYDLCTTDNFGKQVVERIIKDALSKFKANQIKPLMPSEYLGATHTLNRQAEELARVCGVFKHKSDLDSLDGENRQKFAVSSTTATRLPPRLEQEMIAREKVKSNAEANRINEELKKMIEGPLGRLFSSRTFTQALRLKDLRVYSDNANDICRNVMQIVQEKKRSNQNIFSPEVIKKGLAEIQTELSQTLVQNLPYRFNRGKYNLNPDEVKKKIAAELQVQPDKKAVSQILDRPDLRAKVCHALTHSANADAWNEKVSNVMMVAGIVVGAGAVLLAPFTGGTSLAALPLIIGGTSGVVLSVAGGHVGYMSIENNATKAKPIADNKQITIAAQDLNQEQVKGVIDQANEAKQTVATKIQDQEEVFQNAAVGTVVSLASAGLAGRTFYLQQNAAKQGFTGVRAVQQLKNANLYSKIEDSIDYSELAIDPSPEGILQMAGMRAFGGSFGNLTNKMGWNKPKKGASGKTVYDLADDFLKLSDQDIKNHGNNFLTLLAGRRDALADLYEKEKSGKLTAREKKSLEKRHLSRELYLADIAQEKVIRHILSKKIYEEGTKIKIDYEFASNNRNIFRKKQQPIQVDRENLLFKNKGCIRFNILDDDCLKANDFLADFVRVYGYENASKWGSSILAHGSSSGSLLAFTKNSPKIGHIIPLGELEANGIIPFTGEIVMGRKGISQNHVSTSLITNFEAIKTYAFNGGLNSSSSFWSPEKSKSILLSSERYGSRDMPDDPAAAQIWKMDKNRIETEKLRLEYWKKLNNNDQKLVLDNFPVVYGFEPSPDREFKIGAPHLSEIAIKGAITPKEIRVIFVPTNQIKRVQQLLAQAGFPEIKVKSIEIFQ